METQAIDSALLLEGELKRRVKEIVTAQIEEALVKHVGGIIRQEKEALIFEIATGVGKIIRLAEEEGRKPLWQTTPEEFGLTKEELNRSHISRPTQIQNEWLPQELTKEIDDAIRKQT
jgi:hypothetical protein